MKQNLLSQMFRSRQSDTACIAALLLALSAVSTEIAAQDSSASNITHSNVMYQVQQLNLHSFGTTSSSNRQANFASFRRLLETIAAEDMGVRGTPEEETLLRVARQAGEHPERIDELLEAYSRPAERFVNARVQIPPRLQGSHATDAYRAAWEALLLAPPTDNIMFMQGWGTINEALTWIGNPESIPVLELAFVFTCQPGVKAVDGSQPADRQRGILHALSRIPSEESLRAILRSLERSEAAAAQPATRFAGKDLRQLAEQFLTRQIDPAKREKWQEILRKFPKENLPANQRELLERVIHQQGEIPTKPAGR